VVGPTGPTALIRADGTVVREAPLEEPHVVQARLATRTAMTPYTRLGDLPPLLVMVGALLALVGPRALSGSVGYGSRTQKVQLLL
jgi:apolipoprotein N-acyltransferase